MKSKLPTCLPIFYQDIEETYNKIKKTLPVSMVGQADFIDRISAKYPYISKADVILISKFLFEAMRYQLFLGNILCIGKFSKCIQILYVPFWRKKDIHNENPMIALKIRIHSFWKYIEPKKWLKFN